MMRLIDADALAESLRESKDKLGKILSEERCEMEYRICEGQMVTFIEAILRVKDAPTIEAEPVRHGEWVKAQGMMPPEYHHRKCCKLCGGWALQDFFGRERMSLYCPNCGAKMDGGMDNGKAD